MCLETKEPADLSDRWHENTQTHPICSNCAPRVEVLCPVCRTLPRRDETPLPLLPFREHARGSPRGPLLLEAHSIPGPNNLHTGPEAGVVVYPEFPFLDWSAGRSSNIERRHNSIFSRLVVHLTLLTLRIISAESAAQRPDHVSDRRRTTALAVSVSESVTARLFQSAEADSASEEDLERLLSEVLVATRA